MLPSTYRALGYIESSGTQYIDTGIAPSDYLVSLKIEADMSFVTVPTGSSTQSYLFGTGVYKSTAGNRRNVLVGYRGATSTTLFSYLNDGQLSNAVAFTGATLDTNRHLFVIDQPNSQYGFDGATQSFGSTDQSTDNLPILIFCARQSGSSGQPIGYYSSARLYSFKIYNNGTLLRDFQPCVQVSNGQIGLYDLVNDVFYTNQGSGNFTADVTITNVVISADPLGSGTVTGTGYYPIGSSATVTATPNAGYYFVGGRVRVDYQDYATMTSSPYTFTVIGYTTIQAFFNTGVAVTVNVSPANKGTVSGVGSYRAGSIVTLNATPTDIGYVFDYYDFNGIHYENPYQFVIGSSDVTLTAYFKLRDWIPPKTSWMPTDCLNKDDLNRIESDLYILATLYGTTPDMKIWEYGEIPTTEQFARILGLCEDLKALQPDSPSLPTNPINNYSQLNQIETFLLYMYENQ